MHKNLVNDQSSALRKFPHQTRGSVMVISILSVAVLMLVGAATLSIVSRRLNVTVQSTHWNAALAQTETGFALARAALMQSESNPTAAWAAWGPLKTDTASGTQYYERKVVDPADSSRTVIVQADKRTLAGSPRSWWRVRASGSVGMSSQIALSADKNDLALRRISFGRDWAPLRLFGQATTALSRPTATRVVEAILEPVNPFSYALYARQKIDFEQVTLDSYDSSSTDATLRVPAYPPGSKNQMANIGTNATKGMAIDSKPIGHVFGSVSTNGASMLQWQTRATGEYRTDRYVELPSVTAYTPRVTFQETISAGKSITVPASATSWATAYEVRWTGDMTLSKTNTLTFKNNQGGTHAIVQVNGNMDVSSGSSALMIENGVKVKFIVNGNITLRDTAIGLPSDKATDFRVYGMPLDPATVPPSTGKKVAKTSVRTAQLDGGVIVALYAPDHDVFVAKNNVTSIGAVVGRNVDFKGNPQTRFVYDEALAVDEPATDYRIVSWMEDIPMR